MSEMVPNHIECCRSEEVAAYLDGELVNRALLLFEEHLRECNLCEGELREQQRLLNTLDFALGADDPCVALPKDFAQIVAANAESDMSGVRNRVEHRRAIRLCVGLSVAVFVLLGGATLYAAISTPVKAFIDFSAGITGFVGSAFYDAGTSAALIVRVVGRHLIFESHPTSLIAFFLFAIAFTFLPRLIAKYHRAQITE